MSFFTQKPQAKYSDMFQGILRRDLHCYINHPGTRKLDRLEHSAVYQNCSKIIEDESIKIAVK